MKTAMELVLNRLGMLLQKEDSIHWDLFKQTYIEMEKKQIIDAFIHAYLIGEDDISIGDANVASEKYYNEKFKKD